MNRQYKRLQAKEEARAARGEDKRRGEREDMMRTRKRTSPAQFFREIRQELKKVAWPGRNEVVSYTVVVLVSTAVLTALVFGMDYVFGKVTFALFGS